MPIPGREETHTEPRIKSKREVELELALECANDALTQAIDTLKIVDLNATLEICSRLLSIKGKVQRVLRGGNV